MGILSRYKKKGGFIQLLSLIESCPPVKQTKLIETVKNEDHRWSDAISKKMLTINEILNWNEEHIIEIVQNTQELTLSYAIHGFTEEKKQKLFSYLSHSQVRRINSTIELNSPNQAEIITAQLKLIEEVRCLIKNGILRLSEINNDLVIEENIEELLQEQIQSQPLDFSKYASDDHEKTPQSTASSVTNLSGYKKEVSTLKIENQKLKTEIIHLNNKINKINKIIAS